MRVLNSLSYYRPHYSGLTVYTERLARSLAARGHQVTILTSRYDRGLLAVEQVDGVQVRRVNVAFRVSKGPVMPAFPYWAVRLIPLHDVIHLHVPQLDAAFLAMLGKVFGKPVVLTYHCDLRLPPSPINRLANKVSHLANHLSASASDVVITNTQDYAESSNFLGRYLNKLVVIPPPIEVAPVEAPIVDSLRLKWKIHEGQQVIGMAARLATEKGAEVLARALPRILEVFPNARVLYAGQHEDVLGEEEYAQRLQPLLEELGDHWMFLGVLPQEEMSAFFSLCDVSVLPSLNSTESFGMVQVESMFCGTPVVASDLPGMRQPALTTGMGLVFPPGNSQALAEAIIRVLNHPESYHRGTGELKALYGSDRIAERYEELFQRLLLQGERHQEP